MSPAELTGLTSPVTEYSIAPPTIPPTHATADAPAVGRANKPAVISDRLPPIISKPPALYTHPLPILNRSPPINAAGLRSSSAGRSFILTCSTGCDPGAATTIACCTAIIAGLKARVEVTTARICRVSAYEPCILEALNLICKVIQVSIAHAKIAPGVHPKVIALIFVFWLVLRSFGQ